MSYDHWKTTDPTDAQYCACGRHASDCQMDETGHCSPDDDGPCEEDEIKDENYEPLDPPGWEGGFAENH